MGDLWFRRRNETTQGLMRRAKQIDTLLSSYHSDTHFSRIGHGIYWPKEKKPVSWMLDFLPETYKNRGFRNEIDTLEIGMLPESNRLYFFITVTGHVIVIRPYVNV